ncbi:MAG: hypothetical protein L3J31_07900 [Bacteroidales bacterium]|nr:hypothetical protein [Bacteroidales bacterium]
MKRNTLLLLLLVFIGHVATAQNQANIWYFGYNCGIDFNSGIPVNTHEIPLARGYENAVMCDTNGDFLL